MSGDSEPETEKHPQPPREEKQPVDQLPRKIFQGITHDLQQFGFLANFVVGIILLLVGPLVLYAINGLRGAVIAAGVGVTIALWVVVILIWRQIPINEQPPPPVPVPAPSPSPQYFSLTVHQNIQFDYLQMVHVNKDLKLITPVDFLLNLGVTNLRPTPTMIRSYLIDVGNLDTGEWVRVYSLNLNDPRSVYWCDPERKACRFFDFRSNSFDLLAKSTPLQVGEPLKGWVFLTLPETSGNTVRTIDGKNLTLGKDFQIRITVKNSHLEQQTVVLESPTSEPGEVTLGGEGAFKFPPSDFQDLRKYTVHRFPQAAPTINK